MADQRATLDDNVPETLCVGKFNVTTSGPLATIVFTHRRPKAGPLLDQSTVEYENVVRARIVTTTDNLAALRDTIDALLERPNPAASSGDLN